MAFSKIILNGVTQIDLTQDTVAAGNLISPNTAHKADGTQIVGTAIEGVDVPVFTVVWDASYDNVVSASCNKTFSEIGRYQDAILRQSTTEQTDPIDYGAYFYSVNEEAGNEYYHFIVGGGDFANLDIYYYKDSRGVQYIFPSSHNLTLNATSNGTYYPDDGFYSEVTVNVPKNLFLESKTVDPTESTQTITADAGYDGLSSVEVGAISSTYVGSGIDRRTSDDLYVSPSGTSIVTPKGYYETTATKSMPSGSAKTPDTSIAANPSISVDATSGLITANVSESKSVTPTVKAGYVDSGTAGTVSVSGSNTSQLSTQAGTTIVPTESEQTAVAANKYTLGDVKVGAISPTYVGSEIDQNDSDDLTVSGATVTVPAGFYSESASKSIASGSATTPSTTITANPSISISSSGLITATTSASQNITPSVSAGYVSSGTAGTVTVSGSKTQQLTTQAAKTVTPTESEQTAVASGVYTTGVVKVGAISSAYVGSGIDRPDTTDITISGPTVSFPAGYYEDPKSVTVYNMTLPTATSTSHTGTNKATIGRSTTDRYLNIPDGYNSTASYYTISGIPDGTAGTPSATKGTVSNHSISVTPSVTNTTGYITGGTKTGTAVTVTASELASGNKEITSNGTDIDVVGYSTVSVAVPGANLQAKTGISPTTSSQTITADSGYDGLSSVQINAMPTMTLPTSASSSATSGYTSKATIGRSTSAQYINIPTGYNSAGAYYTISATPNGAVTAPSSISGTSATVSTGTNTLTLTKSVSVTPNVTTAGYISAGTAGNSSVSLTASVTTKGTTTYNTSTTDQTIASGTYLTGTQTIKGVTVSGLDASKILSGTTVMIGDANDVDRIASVAGTVTFSTIYSGSSAPSSSTGVNGDIYIQS